MAGLIPAGGGADLAARLPHVDPQPTARTRPPQRCPFLPVMGERFALMAGQEGPVGMDHPPPGDAAAPLGHDPPHLTRAALAQVFGDVAVGHHLAGRDGVHDVEHAVGEVSQLIPVAGGHGPGGGHGSPGEPGSSGGVCAGGRSRRDRSGRYTGAGGTAGGTAESGGAGGAIEVGRGGVT